MDKKCGESRGVLGWLVSIELSNVAQKRKYFPRKEISSKKGNFSEKGNFFGEQFFSKKGNFFGNFFFQKYFFHFSKIENPD